MKMKKGIHIEGEEFQGGGWDIYLLNDMYYLWETPLYGGEPYFIDKFESLEKARESANNLT